MNGNYRKLADASRAAREANRDLQTQLEIETGQPGIFAFINTRLTNGQAQSGQAEATSKGSATILLSHWHPPQLLFQQQHIHSCQYDDTRGQEGVSMSRNGKDTDSSGKKGKSEQKHVDRRALAAQQVWHGQPFHFLPCSSCQQIFPKNPQD